MNESLKITVPCSLRFRDPVGALITKVCLCLTPNDPTLGYQVQSAFNEAFNNLTEYAYPKTPGVVDIILSIEPQKLVLELIDYGEIFKEFEIVTKPDLDNLPESGLGMFIIRSYMNDVQYLPGHKGSKNTLRLTRKIEKHAYQRWLAIGINRIMEK